MAEVKFVSGMSKLYELKAEFEKTIKNINTLQTQYDVLNDIVKKSKREKDLPKDFLESISEYKENLNSQLVTINNRMNCIKTLLDWYEKQDEQANFVNQVVTLTFEAIGIQGESAPIEEKEDGAE